MKKPLFLDLSIEKILSLYKEKRLGPVDVAMECAQQFALLDPLYQAWVCFDAERLLQQAREIESRLLQGLAIRSLEGIPCGVKDIFNTIDFPTQMGSPLWKNFTAGNDARVVAHLIRAGALIPGKTVTAEFAVHTLDKTLNPHDISRTPGTSSSGSAVAVAVGMVPFAMGTQTAGSIVRPASFCGVYGVKPSFGLIPRTGVLKTTDSLDTIGFFVAHAEDIERVFDAVRVNGPDYPISDAILHDKRRQTKPSHRPWKVAFVKTHTWQYAEGYAKRDMLDFVKKLAADKNIEITEVELPREMANAHRIHATIYNKTLSYYFQEEFKKAELVSPIMNELMREGFDIPVDAYQAALAEQSHLARTMDIFFNDYDALISLSTAGHAPVRDVVESPDSALMWTMTHLPVISAPVFTSPQGLPFGVQLVTRRYNDYLLMNFVKDLCECGFIPASINNVKRAVCSDIQTIEQPLCNIGVKSKSL